MVDRRLRFIALGLVLFGLPIGATLTADPRPVDEIQRHLRSRFEAWEQARSQVAGDAVYAVEALPVFYEQRGYLPAWTGEPHVAVAEALLRAIHASSGDGLRPDDYHLASIQALLEPTRRRASDATQLADLDLLLSDAFLTLGAHLVSGRVDPEGLDPEWRAVNREVDLVAVLAEAVAERRPAVALDRLRPPHPGYARLRQALVRYQSLAPWPEIPAVDAADAQARDRAIALRLRATGDLAESPADADDVTRAAAREAALRIYQRRHGLAESGRADDATVTSLSVPRDQRIRQLAINLERWRWLPRELGSRHVLVNIPEYELRVIDAQTVSFTTRAVVGRTYRKTPVMSDHIRYLVLNPYWEVPPSLAVQDKLPEIRKDPAYLARNGFKVFQGWGSDQVAVDPSTVDWTKLGRSSFPYRLRQDPGPLNALGRIKFMFPNPFNVYVHDTPTRETFRFPERAQSSGCVRIADPVDLATLLLEGTEGWDRKALLDALATGATKTVNLKQPVPIHVQYWTASVDEGGIVHFRRDIYERDAALERALAAPPPGGSR